MSSVDGRLQRRQVEDLQGRAKQARLELDTAESPGFSEQLEELREQATTAETDAALLERDARAMAQRLTGVRHDVDEAERQLLAPKAVSSVGPAVSALTVGFMTAALWFTAAAAVSPKTDFLFAAVLACGLLPPPLLALIWRRRLSGGGTFRAPS